MKINNSFMVIKKSDIKEGKNRPYFTLDIVDLDGNVFNLLIHDISTYNDFNAFDKKEMTLELINSKYGLSLKFIE